MARIKLEMPEHFIFSTVLPIRISDINYGGHLGNDAVLSMIHEARVRFLNNYHYTEQNIDGRGLIQIDVAVGDFNKYGCDIFYLLSNKKTAEELAIAKTGVVFFDYEARKVVPMPDGFRASMQKDT